MIKTPWFLILALVCVSGLTPAADNPRVQMTTDLGVILVEVFLDQAPITAGNFLKYVDEDRFEGAVFYRVVTMDNQPGNDIKIEVIQGGLGYASSAQQLDPIVHETTRKTGILHKDGTISMARTDPGTASSEFFICVNDQPALDFGGMRNPDGQGFAAFGRVIKGMEVVRAIQNAPSERQMLTEPVKILSVKMVEKKPGTAS